jgi:hypothetical protein
MHQVIALVVGFRQFQSAAQQIVASESAIPVGSIRALVMAWFIWRVTAPHNGFETAFGADWQQRIPSRLHGNLFKRCWTWLWRETISPEPRFERNPSFWTINGTTKSFSYNVRTRKLRNQ